MVSAQPRTPTKGFNKNYLKIKYFEQEKRVLPYVPRELLVLPHVPAQWALRHLRRARLGG
jgi:hypothetical protein